MLQTRKGRPTKTNVYYKYFLFSIRKISFDKKIKQNVIRKKVILQQYYNDITFMLKNRKQY